MKERFEVYPNLSADQWEIVDNKESEEKTSEKSYECMVIYNDLGSINFSSAPQLCKLLNKLENNNIYLQMENSLYQEATKEIRDLKFHISNLNSTIDELKLLNGRKLKIIQSMLHDEKNSNSPCDDCKYKKNSVEEMLLDKKHCKWCDVPYYILYEMNEFYGFKVSEDFTDGKD